MADRHSSFDVLQAYLVARASFSAEELAFMGTMFVPRRLAAGEFLQHAGDVARYAAFVARGCLRSFVIDGKDLRIVKALSATAAERYRDFMNTFPTIAQRVPQWMVASYLGVSPETISRIRKNRSRK